MRSLLHGDYDPHDGGRDPGCAYGRCGEPSSGALDGVPLCLEHSDAVAERWAAASMPGFDAALWPSLGDE